MHDATHAVSSPPLRHLVAALLAGFLLLGDRPAQAQQPQPTTQDYVRHLQKQMQEAEKHDPSTRRLTRLFSSWMVLVLIACAFGTAVVLFKVVVAVFLAARGTTDPEKLALSDPWVRAQLAKEQAAQGGPY